MEAAPAPSAKCAPERVDEDAREEVGRLDVVAGDLGSSRIVASETEAPIILVNLV